jgi:hypothetical protein
MDSVKVLHFSVTGEFITGISRNLWAEGEHAKAIKLLVDGVRGFSECMALEVVTGQKKLVGTNLLKLVKDNATKDDRGLDLPKSAAAAFTKNREALDEATKEAAEVARAASETFADIEDAVLADADKRSQARAVENRIDAHWDRIGKVLGYVPKPEPTTEYEKWDAGWMAPNGKFYGCKYHGHIALAEELDITEPDCEREGWLKLQNDIWVRPWLYMERYGGHITQLQLDALFDWHQKKGKKLSDWMTAE